MSKPASTLHNGRILPEGWEQALLGDIADIGAGNPAPQGEQFFKDGIYPFVRVQDMGRLGENKHITNTADRINQHAIEKMKLFPKGTVLFTKSGASSLLNQRAILKMDMYVVSHIATAVPFKGVLSEYLYYWLKIIDFNHIAHATTLPSIPISKVCGIQISLASAEEQKQIVNIIEELFSGLDNAIENLKKAQDQLRVYRQSVIGNAVDGKDFRKIGDLIDPPKYGTSRKCRKDSGKRAVLRIPNIGYQYIDPADLKYAEFTNEEAEKYSLKDGDLLMIRSNGSVSLVGKVAVVTKQDENMLYAGYLIRLRPKSELDSRYAYYVLSSPQLRNQIEFKAKSTSGVHNINSEEIKDLRIPYCRLEEQRQIVGEIEARLLVCDQTETTLEEVMLKANVLRQSILKQAFEGKLTGQWRKDHKELISGENSAEKLVEKIKAVKKGLEGRNGKG